ncbi:MAG: YCF48-related protein [Bacteroidales bacterium]
MRKTLLLINFTLLCNFVIFAQSLVWTQQTSGTINNLTSVFATGANTAYVVGKNGTILKTSNGGQSWVSQISGTTTHLNSIYFTDANTGFIVGDNGMFLKTTNGGANWVIMPTGVTTRPLYTVFFTDANTGYIAGGYLYNSSSYSIIRKTTNGGTTWTSIASGVGGEIRSIYFTDSLTGCAVGFNGVIYKTINGGTQWAQKFYNIVSYNYLYSVHFPDNNTAYAVGLGKIVKSSNAGNNWTEKIGLNILYSVYFPDTSFGFAVGMHGKIIQTFNGGTNWSEQISGITSNLNSVYFANYNTGYAVGDSGIILKTTIGSAPTAGNNDTICEGSPIYLTASTINGATYNWTGPNGFTSTLQNPTINNAAISMNGTYYVTATVNGNTTPTGSTLVVVNAIPTKPTAGSNSPVVVGDSIQLSASTINGATYNWTGPNNFTSSTQNPTINNSTLAMNGFYKVWVNANGCTGNADSTLVIVNNFTANDSACGTEEFNNGITAPLGWTYTNINNTYTTAINCGNLIPSLMLDATGDRVETAPVHNVSKLSFWLKGNGTDTTSLLLVEGYNGTSWLSIANITNLPVNGTTKSYYNVSNYIRFRFTYIKSVGNIAFDDVEVICGNTIPPTPVAGNNGPVCAGSSLTLTSSTIAGATYNWTGPNGFYSSQQNPLVSNSATIAMNGIYNVTATVNGVTSLAGTTNVSVNPIPSTPIAGNDTSICFGMILNLTATSNAGASYLWSGPNAFTSNQQNPVINNTTTVMSGMYIVIATLNGCNSPAANTIVTIKPIPNTPTAGNNSPVCEGSMLSLTSTTVSGANYSWTGPNGFTSLQQNPTVSNNSTTTMTGTYSVIAILNGCNSPAANTIVTIKPIPNTPTAGNNGPVCEGSMLSLTSTTVSGANYSWTGPNGFTSLQQNPTVSNNSTTTMTGTYSVIAILNGCNSPAANTIVTIKPIPNTPTAGNNGTVCAGSLLTLTASTVSGASYSWTGPNGFISSQQNPTVSFNSTTAMSGIYYVTAIVNGCSSQVANTIVTLNAVPSAPIAGNNGPVIIGSILSLSASSITGASYSWTGPNSFTSGQQSPTVSNNTTIAMAGIYKVKATVNSCTSQADSTLVVVNSSIPNDSACGTEEFSNGINAPSGWTYTNIGSTYQTIANSGNAVPSLTFDATGDVVETAPVHNVSNLSFWIKGISTDAASSLLIQGYNGTLWVTIDNFSNIPSVGTIKTYNNISIYSKFKFLYIQSAGNLAFDDLKIICGPLSITENQNENTISIFPNPTTGNITLDIPKNTKYINILNSVGQLINSSQTEGEKSINFNIERAGIYFLQVIGLKENITKKVIVYR